MVARTSADVQESSVEGGGAGDSACGECLRNYSQGWDRGPSGQSGYQ